MSIDAKRRYASAAFVTLLILSVFWPSPIVSSNRLWLGRNLAVDELSFLGREAPSWDVVFWCLAGLLALAIVQTGDIKLHQPIRWDFAAAGRRRTQWGAGAVAGASMVALTWFTLDATALAWAEQIQSNTTRSFIRIINRFGGGMNPPMIVIFFALCGFVYRAPHWIRYAAAMTVAALSAGLTAHILKFAVGRTRPELWLGPYHHAGGGANSFPSGHTVGAFAIAGVLLFASRNVPLRFIALILAVAVGISRVMAFRHWLSDVVASAFLGLLAAWIAVDVIAGRSDESPPLATAP